jgi:hypothetical protein
VTDDPTDAQWRIPKPNPSLTPLGILVGAWDVEISFSADPSAVIRGRVSFEWLDGGAFLVMRSEMEEGPPRLHRGRRP